MIWDSPSDATASIDASAHDPNDTSEPPRSDFAGRGSRRPLVIGAIAIVTVLTVGFLAWPRDQDGVVSELASEQTDTASTTLGTLPDTSEVETDPAAILESVTPPSDEGDDSSGDASATIDRIELPSELADLPELTELVAQSVDGQLHTISLPSGRVRTVDLGVDQDGLLFGGNGLVAGPDAAMISSYENDPIIVPRSGVPFPLDLADFGDGTDQITPYGWITDDSGNMLFVVAAYQSVGDTQQSFLVASDGTIVAQPSATLSNFALPTAAHGVQIINDAGGAYRLDPDGVTVRIADGTVLASSNSQILVRECDDARVCDTVIRNIDGSDRRVVDLPDSIGNRFFGLSLSPDGTAVSYSVYGQQPRRLIIDFDGNEFEADANTNFGPTGAWVADSSGEFSVAAEAEGIAFLDRTSGETIVFATELGRVGAVAARYPDSELLDISRDTAPIAFSPGPPSGEVGLDLVTVGRIGGMTHLDLDGSVATRWETPRVGGGIPPQLFSDATSVLAISVNGREAFISEFGRATELDAGAFPAPPLLPGPAQGTVWARPLDATLDVERMLFGLDGTRLNNGVTVTVDRATLLGGDSSGGLVIETGGDVYVTAGGDPGGFTTGLNRLTTGEILALGTGHAIVRECDTVRNCTTSKLDRRTRELTTISGSAVVASDAVTSERDPALIGSMSPDGNVVLARLDPERSADADPTETWALFDLVSGTEVVVNEPAPGQPLIWNDDSSYAAFASDDTLFIYERATASILTVEVTSRVWGLAEVDESFSVAAGQN